MGPLLNTVNVVHVGYKSDMHHLGLL